MIRRTTLKRFPELERVEEKCLLNAATAAIAPAVVVDALPGSIPVPSLTLAFPHASRPAEMTGPGLHTLHKGRAGSNFSLVSVSTPLPAPVARVQVDDVGLISGRTYTISALEVQNATSSSVVPHSFKVGVAGRGFTRSFPDHAWQRGQTIVFFAPVSFASFAFHVPGPVASIPSNTYYNVIYNPSTFTTTLHNLINSSQGVGGRFQLV